MAMTNEQPGEEIHARIWAALCSPGRNLDIAALNSRLRAPEHFETLRKDWRPYTFLCATWRRQYVTKLCRTVMGWAFTTAATSYEKRDAIYHAVPRQLFANLDEDQNVAQRFMLTGKPKQADVGTDARLCIDFMKDTVCRLVTVGVRVRQDNQIYRQTRRKMQRKYITT